MILRISRIKNMGVFPNFSGTGLSDFAKFNLIYGWNYSGKTTLSRAFQSIHNGKEPESHPLAEIEFISSSQSTIQPQSTSRPSIRVFNEDFRKEHLEWDQPKGINPILILGSENVEANNELKNKNAKLKSLRAERESLLKDCDNKEKKIKEAESHCARQIAYELPLPKFTRTHVDATIKSWKGNPPNILTAPTVKQKKLIVTAEERSALALPSALENNSAAWRLSDKLLSETILKERIIEKFIASPEIATWVEEGIQLHSGKKHCEFCQGELRKERVEELRQHFSKALSDLKIRVQAAQRTIENSKYIFSVDDYPESAFYPDMRAKRKELVRRLLLSADNYNQRMTEMFDALEAKYNLPFDEVASLGNPPDLTELAQTVTDFHDLIDEHNTRTSNFNKTRNEAVSQLRDHYIADSMKTIDRERLDSEIVNLRVKIQEIEQKERELAANIVSLEARLSDAAGGALRINELLLKFFGNRDLEIKVNEAKRFEVFRRQSLARNLSEGERTAISFCYFIAKLEEEGTPLADTIVYIDDPISSLDSNHLLHVCALIKNTFYKLEKPPGGGTEHRCLAKQLFISTHNHEFFSILFDWLDKTKKVDHRIYLIERADTDDQTASRLIDCPESISHYRSEYLYLFGRISDFRDHPQADHNAIFNIGNMLRRFVEGYLYFKFLEHSNIDTSIARLIADPIEAERARKFMHLYSHTLSRTGGINAPNMSEARAVIDIVIEAIRNQDRDHYSALQSTLPTPTPPSPSRTRPARSGSG